jgi:uncharacterized protein YxeA
MRARLSLASRGKIRKLERLDMFSASRSPRLANKAVIPTCLLALTSFLAGSWQARAQTATADARSTSAERQIRLGGHTPRKVKDGTAMRLDHYDPHQKLRLAIFVTPRDLAGQEKLLAELQDKKSPNFHKWLTADEWNARFGPRVEDEQAVVDWVKGAGLTVTNRFANRMIVDVEAESGTIEQALNVTINHYKVGDEVDFSNDRDPSIPQHLSGIVGGIFGLTSIERLKPADSRHTEARHPDYVPGPMFSTKISGHGEGDPSRAPWAQESAAGKAGAPHGEDQPAPVSSEGAPNPNPNNELGGINPSNLYSSQGYDLGPLSGVSRCCNVHNDSNGSPADTSIGLVTFGGFNYSDYTAFTTYYGMAWNITAYQIDGAATTATTDCQIDVSAPGSSCPGDGLDDEADLDTEWSTAFANSYGSYLDTAHVYVYEGSGNYFSNFFDTWNYVLSDAHAHVISSSYDWTEESFQADDPGWMTGTVAGDAHYVFNALVAQGNTLISSSGDQGSTSGCSNANQVFWPTDDPDFLSAGGTSLSLNYDGSFGSETAWVGGSTLKNCQSNGGGGGGGVSVYFSAPSWQSGITYEEMYNGGDYIVSNQPNRMIPDMSLNATGNFQWDYCTTPACKNTAPDGWATWGGTSIVAPELAGFFVQVNSYLNAIGHICGSAGTSACEPIGNPDPLLYDIGKHAGATNYEQHYPFYDTNQLCVTNYLTAQNPDLLYFCATDGYDLATGWGSANLLQLSWAINWWVIPSYGSPSVSFTGPATNTWYNSNQTVSWTVADGTFSGSTTPAPGVAGFTQGWDSLPADPTSEPHGGTGNAFYSGPEFPLGTSGCLAFSANGCSGSVGQGCHTVEVRAWDNQGYANTYTYGPLCYDTVAPTISISNSPATPASGWWDTSVKVTLSATDPGGAGASGIAHTYYGIDTGYCYPGNQGACSVYTGPFTVSAAGQHYIYYFTVDNAGNFSNETYEWVSIDETAPTTTASLSGNQSFGTYYSKVGVTLTPVDTGGSGVAATYYTVDGGAQKTYGGSAFTISAVGSHTIRYWSVDSAGNVEAVNSSTFTIATELAPTLTSPAPGGILPGPTVTFAWTTEPGATGYYITAGTTGAGSNNLINSAQRTTPSYTYGSMPTTGVPIYVRVTTVINSTWASQDFVYTAATQAAMTSPASNSVLAGPTVTFNWATANGSATGYYLQIGSTGVGSSNILNSAQRTTPSYTISTMPTNGEPIYVRLITNFNGPWVHYDYTYTAATQGEMTSPAPTSVLPGPTATFTWSAAAGATGYYLQIGSTGAGSDNIYNSAQKTVTSYTFTGLPTNGEPIYVRLTTNYNGPWVHIDYTYTAATQAEMTAPAQGSVLAGPLVTFNWSAAAGATGYYLQIGSTGVGSDNIYNSSQKTGTSYTFSGMPTNGEPIYVRLTTNYGGPWVHLDYTYTAASEAVITSPAASSVLPGPVVTFDWSAAVGATGYYIQIGSTGVGSSDIYNSSQKTTTSYTTTTMPSNGEPIYVRLITNYGGTWVHVDTTYTAASAAAMISPTPASTFTGASVTFTWSPASGATGYYLQIGSTGAGSDDIYNSAQKTVTSYTFNAMPTNGEPIYVRLTTNYSGTWVHTDYTYTAE